MIPERKIFVLSILFAFLVSWLTSFSVYELIMKNDVNYQHNSTNPPSDSQISKNAEIEKQKLSNLESWVKSIAQKIWPSVVNIIISKDIEVYRTDPFWFFQEPSWTVNRKVWWWTGFFITKNWLILTNKHVVGDENASYTIITSNWTEYQWKVVALDPTNDLAIIKALSKDWKELKDTKAISFIQDRKDVSVWNFVVAIWNALAEFQNTVTFWVVSWKWRSIEAAEQWSVESSEQLTWLLQTDAAINPWNSGWPLVNLDSKVIWINTAIAAWANNLWFAIPLSQKEIDHMLSSISKYWKIVRSFVWIRYISLNPGISQSLWLKSEFWDYIWADWQQDSIIRSSPAEAAWLVKWDIILSLDWVELKNWISTKDIVKDKFPWDKVIAKLMSKDWKIRSVTITLWKSN